MQQRIKPLGVATPLVSASPVRRWVVSESTHRCGAAAAAKRFSPASHTYTYIHIIYVCVYISKYSCVELLIALIDWLWSCASICCCCCNCYCHDQLAYKELHTRTHPHTDWPRVCVCMCESPKITALGNAILSCLSLTLYWLLLWVGLKITWI